MADSTTEAEYITACEAAKEAVWIRQFLDELDVVCRMSKVVDVYCGIGTGLKLQIQNTYRGSITLFETSSKKVI